MKKTDIYIFLLGLGLLIFSIYLTNKKFKYSSIIENTNPIEYELISVLKKYRPSGKSSNEDYILEVVFNKKKYEVDIDYELYENFQSNEIHKAPLYYISERDLLIAKSTIGTLNRSSRFFFISFIIILLYTTFKYVTVIKKTNSTYISLNSEKYVYVEKDGSVRELYPDEKEYLETKFSPTDGARPYVKYKYKSLTPDKNIYGFLLRKKVPNHIIIKNSNA